MLYLYYSRKSCAYAPHILLHDAGAAFEVSPIETAKAVVLIAEDAAGCAVPELGELD